MNETLEKMEAEMTEARNATAEGIRLELWKVSQTPKLTATERAKEYCDAVLGWLHVRGDFYHLASRPDFDGALYFDGERRLLQRIRSDAFLAWLADSLAMNRGERNFQLIQSAVETESLTERSHGIEPSAYWAARPGAVYLSNGPGHIVKATAESVSLVDNGTDGVLFPADAVLPTWDSATEPVNPFEACTLFREMSTTAPHGKLLFELWALSLPTNQQTKPPLCTTGVVGSGKTRAVVGLFELYGLPPRVAAVTKGGEGDFWTEADAGGLACWDNADTRIDWLPDALAAAATGGCQSKRKLYSDAERVVLRARSWVAVTSANPAFAADAGLADRLLVVRLNRREGGTAEAALSAEIAAARDAGLSWVCHTIRAALADDAPVPSGLNSRHPDFAAFAVRLGRALGREADAVAALRAAEADKSLFCIQNDTIGAAILEAMQGGTLFNGTANELLERLKANDASLEGTLSARRLGKRMSKLWPHLVAALGAKQEAGHGGSIRYTLKPPSNGGFGGFQTAFSEKSAWKDNIETFAKTPHETHQTNQAAYSVEHSGGDELDFEVGPP
ncbi:MAG: hypothetical protein EOL90_08275 [Spartobacteria bacterium]|nr:hypothetical protein [Spartobacteria bacterium]